MITVSLSSVDFFKRGVLKVCNPNFESNPDPFTELS